MKAEQNPTVEQARQLLASEEGRKLLALLSQGGGKEPSFWKKSEESRWSVRRALRTN